MRHSMALNPFDFINAQECEMDDWTYVRGKIVLLITEMELYTSKINPVIEMEENIISQHRGSPNGLKAFS